MNLSLGPTEAEALRAIHAALDAGMEMVDTADVYGRGPADAHHNEALVGRALRKREAYVTTKVGVVREGERWIHRGAAAHLRRSLEASVKALGRAPDLVLLHAPPDDVPLRDALDTLAALRDAGLCGAIGASNLGEDAIASLPEGVVVVQNELSPYVPPGPWLESTRTRGLAAQGYAPMGGWRAGRTAHEPPLRAVADVLGITPFEVIVPWLLAQGPHVTLVCGGTDPAKIESSAHAATRTLPDELRMQLDRAYAQSP